MANAAVWRKMALNRQPVGCGQSDEYEAGTWLMVVGHLHSPSDPTEYSVLPVFLLTLGCWPLSGQKRPVVTSKGAIEWLVQFLVKESHKDARFGGQCEGVTMTLAVAIKAQDAIVIAADSRGTIGDPRALTAVNDTQQKIFQFGACALAISGASELTLALIDELGKRGLGNPSGPDEGITAFGQVADIYDGGFALSRLSIVQ